MAEKPEWERGGGWVRYGRPLIVSALGLLAATVGTVAELMGRADPERVVGGLALSFVAGLGVYGFGSALRDRQQEKREAIRSCENGHRVYLDPVDPRRCPSCRAPFRSERRGRARR